MHNLENRLSRVHKRAKARPSKTEKIVFKVLKKFKVPRIKQSNETPCCVEPVRLSAYDSKNLPSTILAFLEASNRKRKNLVGKPQLKKVQKEENFSEKEANEENVYCECKKPYAPGELMFKCEGFCEGWYHPDCMKMRPDEVERQISSNERWYCPTCVFQAQKIVQDTTDKSVKKPKYNA